MAQTQTQSKDIKILPKPSRYLKKKQKLSLLIPVLIPIWRGVGQYFFFFYYKSYLYSHILFRKGLPCIFRTRPKQRKKNLYLSIFSLLWVFHKTPSSRHGGSLVSAYIYRKQNPAHTNFHLTASEQRLFSFVFLKSSFYHDFLYYVMQSQLNQRVKTRRAYH